jgi:hypothetical protein
LHARPVKKWSYADLFKESEIVVIARAITTEEGTDGPNQAPPKPYLKPVITTFDVVQTLKGNGGLKKLTVFHYRLDPERREVIVNGPMLVTFHSDNLKLKLNNVTNAVLKPEYLLFLKKRGDDRYECVSGQYDPRLSVKLITSPVP